MAVLDLNLNIIGFRRLAAAAIIIGTSATMNLVNCGRKGNYNNWWEAS